MNITVFLKLIYMLCDILINRWRYDSQYHHRVTLLKEKYFVSLYPQYIYFLIDNILYCVVFPHNIFIPFSPAKPINCIFNALKSVRSCEHKKKKKH